MAKRKRASTKPKSSSPEKSHVPYILLVEDEPTHVAVISHTIRSANPNAVVKVAGSLKEYRSAISKSLPDIALIDMYLPDGKALEVLTSPPETASFPIVVMTSSGDEKIAVKAMKAGALDYIVKSTETFKAMPHTIERALHEWKLIRERKQVEQALSESELRFRTLYENVTVGLYRTTPAGKILLANRALVKMLGYTSFEQLAERNLVNVGFSRRIQRKEFLRKIEAEGEVNDFESTWVRQDGSLLFVRESARAIRDSQGKTLFYDGTVEDITERRLAESASRYAEDALRESEEKFRSIAENLHDVIFVTDTKGVISYISSAVHLIFGYKSGEMIDHFFGEYLDKTELTRIFPLFEKGIRTGVPTKRLSLLAKRKDGSTFHAELDTSIIIKHGKVQGTTGIIRDISERRQAEEALRESENRMKSIFRAAPIGIGTVSNRVITDANTRLCEMTGYQRKELVGNSARMVYPTQKEFEYVGTEKYRQIAEKGTGTIETVWKRKDGVIIQVLLSSTPIDPSDLSLGVTFTALDITERKQAEEALRQSEEKFRSVFESANVGKSITLPTGEIYVNKAFCDMLGYTQKELKDKKWQELTALDEVDKNQKLIDTLLFGEKDSVRFNKQYIHKAGFYVWVDISVAIVRDSERKPLYFISTVMDITERKRAEEALQKEHALLRKINDTVPVGITYVDSNGKITFANVQAEKIFGLTKDKIAQRTYNAPEWRITDNQGKPFPVENLPFSLVAKTRQPVFRVEHAIEWHDGTRVLLSINASPLISSQGEFDGMVTSIEDITDRRQAQAALQASEEKYRGIVEQTMMGIGISQGNQIVLANKALVQIFKYDNLEEFKKIPLMDHVAPSSRKLITGRMKMAAEGKILPAEFEYDIVCKGGLIRTLHASSTHITIEGKTYTQTTFVDITERKQAEEALNKSLIEWQTTFDATNDAMWILDKDQRILHSNRTAERIFQRANKELIGNCCWQVVHGTMQPIPECPVLLAKDSLQRESIELQIGDRWFEVLVDPILDAEGRYDGAVHIVSDITERRRAEEALQKSNERLHMALESASSGTWEWDLLTNENIWSDELWLLYGLEPNSCVPSYEVWCETIYLEDRDKTAKKVQDAAREGTELNAEWRVIGRDGLVRWLMSRGRPLRDAKDKVVRFNGIVVDITERKRMEEALRQSESQFRELWEATVEGIVILEKGMIVEVNSAMCQMFGYTREQAIGKSILEFSPNEMRELISERIASGTEGRFETPALRADGTRIIFEVFAKQITYQGKPMRMVVAHDITERKRAEEALVESEKHLRAIIDNAPFGAHLYELQQDEKLVFIGANLSADKILKIHHQQLIGKTIEEAFPPLAKTEIPSAYRWVAASGENFQMDQVDYDADDIRGAFEIHAFRIGSNRMAVFFRDITERKQAEDKLAATQALLRSTIEQSPIPMVVSVPDGTVTIFNQACLDILGVADEPDIKPGMNLFSIKRSWQDMDLEGNPLSPHESPLALAIQGKATKGKEMKIRRKDGTERWEVVDGVPINDSAGNLIAGLIIFPDITERKQAEEALRESEIKYRELIDGMNETVWIIDFNGTLIDVNKSAYEVLGYSKEELLTIGLYGIDSSLKKENIQALAHSMQSDKTQIFETTHRTKDGITFPVEVCSSLVTYQGKKSILSIARNITERKRAEEALRQSHNMIIKLTAQVPGVVYQYRLYPDGRSSFPFASPGMNEIYEVTPEEVQEDATPVFGRLHPEDYDLIVASIQKSARTLQPFHCEFRVVLPRQGLRWRLSDALPERMEDGGTLWHGIISDITERKRVEEALQESEIRFRSLYENATIGLYRTTPDGKILLANPTLVKMLGYASFQHLAERNLEKEGFEPSYQRKDFLEKIERVGEVDSFESKWTLHDGTAIHVLESARAIRDSQGKTLYYDGTVEDITKRKLLEDQLRQMQKLEGLGTLAGGIAHDFNNILGIILAYITSVQRSKNDIKKIDLAVDTIVKTVDRGKTLVQQILTFARKTKTEFGPVNVNEVVMDIMTIILETFPKVLTYSQNIDKSIPSIYADRSQLHQVLLNLCVNARDAMTSGGVLTINTHMVSGVNVRTQHPEAGESSYICLEVGDTGEGMTEEIKNRIFEPFFTTKEKGKGTGLGLAVVFGVVQAHKGFIDVESELGKGTTFRLYLPALQATELTSVKDEETLEEIPGGTETLLVVEDEEMLMMSLRMVLVEKGYQVLTAGDGLEAVNLYKERMQEIALVLTDLGLPTMNGAEECAQIKKVNPNARIILATGFLDPEVHSEFLKSGIQHFLYKPYNLKQVLKVVREVLDGK